MEFRLDFGASEFLWSYSQSSGAISIPRKQFAIEKTLPGFRYIEDEAERKRVLETIRAIRDEESRPLVEQLKTWMGEQSCLPKSKLGQIIPHAMNNWDCLGVYLNDSRAPMTNNQAERSIRPAVVGWKNHYGSKSRRGTEVAALLYSLIGTCRMLKLDPTKCPGPTHIFLAVQQKQR